MSTPHNSARKGDIADTVLMPGDPLRARFIAETYLENPVEFNRVRGMLGYTGTYAGRPVSVMGSGMGMPSIGIYSHELFAEYGVGTIVRVGSAGGYDPSLGLHDVVMVVGSYSESSYARCQSGFAGDTISADSGLCAKLRESAGRLGVRMTEGTVHCSDVFYYDEKAGSGGAGGAGDEPYWKKIRREKGCFGVEMESFALFHNAATLGRKAACLVTISDMMEGGASTDAQERERGFSAMIEIALGILR